MFKIKKILWTGGWDSTFRVLDLVLNKKMEVQPYYIYDQGRKSAPMELKTMSNIKDLVRDIDNAAAKRILDLITIDKHNIPKNAKITESYKTLVTISHLGGQYDWLARYCESNDISGLELCVHKGDTEEVFLKDDVRLVQENGDSYYELVEIPSQEEIKIFSYYRFPLLGMTKVDMGNKAKENGFDHIMEATWFCHNPYKGKPCGMCNPCKTTREKGLGRRVPNPTFTMKLNRKINGKLNGLKKRLKLS